MTPMALAVRRFAQTKRLVSTLCTTPEHENVKSTLRKWIDNEVNPYVNEWEAQGLDYTFALTMAEELGHVACGGVPMAIGVQTDMATPALARFGSDELRKQFLAPTIAGDFVACVGVSEVGAGSDVSAIKTQARKDGDDYVINGGKMWITNGINADWMCLLANTSTGKPHQSKSLICVPLNTKGVTRLRKLDKLGMRSSDTAEILFEDVRVPQKFRIGDEGKGFVYQMLQFQEERLWAAASCLISMETCIQQTKEYTEQRIAFGKPILYNQVVHFRLAELQTEVELLRSLTYRAAQAYVKGEDVTLLASMAKLKAGRLVREVTDSCLQYFGGMGFMNETPISRAYRDTRVMSIGGGADEVMLGIISKLLGLLPK